MSEIVRVEWRKDTGLDIFFDDDPEEPFNESSFKRGSLTRSGIEIVEKLIGNGVSFMNKMHDQAKEDEETNV